MEVQNTTMREPGSRVLYRLRGHIAGVNWRPTRFAEAVSNIRICGLCHMIPKKTVALPCEHFLCESCLTTSAQDGGGICLLDGEAFAADECSWNAFADRKARSLKAHCWNQPHGCEFVGTMDAVLRHYEAECTFHLVECQQCGVQVLHNELVAHRMAGCRGGTPLPTTDHGDTVTMGDVRAAVEELKAFMRDPHHDQLPALQSQMNELMEQCRQCANEALRLLTESAEDVKGEVSRIASTVQEIHSRSVPQEEAMAANLGVENRRESIPWHMEKMLILRRLEVFPKHVLNSLEQLRRNNEPDGTARTPVLIKSLCDKESLSNPTYRPCHDFKLRNANEVYRSCRPLTFMIIAHQIVWDRRDRFFKVTFRARGGLPLSPAKLMINLECFSLVPSARLPSGALYLTVMNKDSEKNLRMEAHPAVKTSPDSLYYDFNFSAAFRPLMDEGFLINGELQFRLSFDD